MASSTKFGRRMEEVARELAEEFGELPESDEPLITQIEDWAIEIGDAVMAKVMQQKLRSPGPLDGEPCCPTCGRPGRYKGNRRRLVQTRRGKVHIEEAEHYCSGCRKSFFPDVEASRH